jgi:hypothetical protein
MSDLFERITADFDVFKKLLAKIPGFKGYIEKQDRRAADKLLRETVASRFEELWQRISSLQRDLISSANLEYVDDMEAAAIKLRQFIDRVRTAAYGYAGFFDAVKVKEEELAKVYQYDYAMFELRDQVSRAIDNIETSMGSDGLPAAIRNLTNLAQQCIDVFERRHEVMTGGIDPNLTQSQ